MKVLKKLLELITKNKLIFLLILIGILSSVISYNLGRPIVVKSNIEKIDEITKNQNIQFTQIDSITNRLNQIQVEQSKILKGIHNTQKNIINLEVRRNEQINDIRTLPIDGTLIFLSTRYDSISKSRLSK